MRTKHLRNQEDGYFRNQEDEKLKYISKKTAIDILSMLSVLVI
jgi:hypothetical protein